MNTDPWAVQDGYWDVEGGWHAIDPQTHRAILAAMGVEEAGAAAASGDPVRVLYPGDLGRWSQPGSLTLEDGTRLRVEGPLPPDLPWGYHDFRPDGADRSWRLIVTPGECLVPEPAWGWAAQLYAVRSQASWGIGDLADLRELAQWSAELGAGLLMLNPLDADCPALPQQASPYYPTSRRFLNPLYLRVEEVPGAGRLGPRLEKVAAAGRALDADRRIDRDAVFRLKMEALEAIWAESGGGGSGDGLAGRDFEEYCRLRQAELEPFATYCALAVRFGGDWRQWPVEYRDPNSPAVRQFAGEHQPQVRFHQWLQWLLERQLAAAADAVPLVQDLPVGFSPGGADAWVWQDLVAKDCTIGAPPDAFNRAGQDWAMPPFVPHRLRAAGYEPIVQTLRAVLRHAGGLRIDHVMGLFRLYWIPQGLGPARGAYVRYRGDELMGILALESRRAGAFVVGEDLGTVEDETRRRMAECRALSFRVLWFEPRPPAEYPQGAMAAASTHDLPTIAGLLSGHDQAAQRAAGMPNDQAMEGLRQHLARLVPTPPDATIPQVIEATYQRLGQAPSRLLVATLEDALALSDRPNMPGTTTQYPNWSLALPGGIDALRSAELPRRIAAALGRGKTPPPK
jgi:4-alpha-glucanotransferase